MQNQAWAFGKRYKGNFLSNDEATQIEMTTKQFKADWMGGAKNKWH